MTTATQTPVRTAQTASTLSRTTTATARRTGRARTAVFLATSAPTHPVKVEYRPAEWAQLKLCPFKNRNQWFVSLISFFIILNYFVLKQTTASVQTLLLN